MKITASSLSIETSFDQCALTSFKLVSGSLSVQASSSPGMVASISIETSFEKYPTTNLKITSSSLSLNAQYVPASIASLSLTRHDGYVQLIDIKKGTAIMITRST